MSEAVTTGLAGERRSKERFSLRCPVLVFRDSADDPVRATVLNISSSGIYWISRAPFPPLETVRCKVYLTPEQLNPVGSDIVLECRARVVRVEAGPAGFCVGASIVAYSVSSFAAETVRCAPRLC